MITSLDAIAICLVSFVAQLGALILLYRQLTLFMSYFVVAHQKAIEEELGIKLAINADWPGRDEKSTDDEGRDNPTDT